MGIDANREFDEAVKEKHGLVILTYDEYAALKSDSERLDYLQTLTRGYGKGWLLCDSTLGRGMMLHETSQEGGTPDVREAIDEYTKEVG